MPLGEFTNDKAIATSRGSKKSIGASDTPSDTPGSKLLTPADVSAITGLSVETLAQWRSQKRGIPYVKNSRNFVRYRQVDLDQWIGEHIVRVEVDHDATRRA
jgi:predicted DNA-binding transcriptional regulator AlpA